MNNADRIAPDQTLAYKIPEMVPPGLQNIWWITFTEMTVDQDNRCFLDPYAERQIPGGLNRIIVRRDTNGYHVTIPGHIPVSSVRRQWLDS